MFLRLCAAIALALLPSCGALGLTPDPVQPAQTWVRASRANYDVLAPVLVDYLEADAELSPLSLEVLRATLEDWDFMIRQGEAIYPDDSAATPVEVEPEASELGGGE